MRQFTNSGKFRKRCRKVGIRKSKCFLIVKFLHLVSNKYVPILVCIYLILPLKAILKKIFSCLHFSKNHKNIRNNFLFYLFLISNVHVSTLNLSKLFSTKLRLGYSFSHILISYQHFYNILWTKF